MNTIATKEINDIMGAVHYRPAVSLIMPFEPKMSSKTELAAALRSAVDKVEVELLENYPDEISRLVMQKLRSITNNINYSTYKKSIAIYVSPVFEKILYLDMPVNEKIIIDESFEIRDLLYCKKQMRSYLVLILNSSQSQVYLGNNADFVRIISDTAQPVRDIPSVIANFTDAAAVKEVLMDKFMRHMDHSLDIILNAYPLPLFIIGPDKVLGHFKKISHHNKSIVGCVHGNYESIAPGKLKQLLEPYLADWEKIKYTDLLNQMEEAAGQNKLATGIQDVWRDATNGKGRLLLIEKDYMYVAEHGSADEIIHKAIGPYNQFSYIKDAVDDIIEKVLQHGGNVEFVNKELLSSYDHIALVKYY